MQVVEQPKSVMIDPNYKRRNQQKIEEAEKEIEELLKKASGEPEEVVETEEEVTQEETPPEEPTKEEDTELSAEEKNWKQRYADLRSHSSKREKELQDKLEQAKNQSGTIRPPTSEEDLEAWSKKYPDVASIVETIAYKKAQELFDQAGSKFKELDDLTYETKVAKATKAIREKHADFDTLKASDDFHTWAEKQPKWVQDALYENEEDAQSVVRVIDLYKMDKGITPQQKKVKAKEAASDVKTKGSAPKVDIDASGKVYRESQVHRMSDKEFEANYDKILESQRNGTFVYDMSNK